VVTDPLLEDGCTVVELVEAVRALHYARPSHRTVAGMIRERRGTCSTKHLFLARELARRFPESAPQIVHQAYTLRRRDTERLFGAPAAAAVPAEGLTDVHRYLTAVVDGTRITLDATFRGPAWDGHSAPPLACRPGEGYPVGSDPDSEKRMLELQHCDPAAREPFTAALSEAESDLQA
jgi:hypothetical protein